MRVIRGHHATSTLAKVLTVALLLFLSSVACRAGESLPGQAGLLGLGDWVSIRIAGQPDATSNVAADGTLNVPLVGNIPVSGITPDQAAERIAKALRDGGYFVDPKVSVRATQTQGQFVSVVGEVQSQGRYPITARTTIVELLAQAGGMKDTAADTGFVLRKDDSGHLERYPVNLNVLADAKEAAPALLGGDSLLVPRAEQFSVEGQVTTPGRYRIERGMTVMQAIARAGGITERGSEHRIQLKREVKPGEYKNLKPKPGDLVQANDVIRVKESLF